MALSEIEKLERRYAENPQGLTFAPLAEVHRKNGDVARALELLRLGLTLHPDYIPASIVLGRCHLDLGELPAAEVAFNHVLSLDAENVIALKALADITERQYRFDEAERLLRLLLAVDRSNDEARDQLGRVETSRRQAETASSASPDAASAVTAETLEAAGDATGLAQPAMAEPVTAESPAPDLEDAEQEPAAPAMTLPPMPEPPREATLAWVEGSTAADKAPPLELEELDLSVGDDALPPEGIELEQPVSLDETVEPLSGLVGRESGGRHDDSRDPSDGWQVETAEDIVLQSSGGGEFQVANASEELLSARPFHEPEPLMPERPPLNREEPATAEPQARSFESAAEPEAEAAEEQPVAATDAASAEPVVRADDSAREQEAPHEAPVPATPVARAPPLAEPPRHSEPDLVVTESMAELLLRQGHTAEALTVFRHLVDRTGESRFEQKAAELERMAAAPAPTLAPESVTVPAAQAAGEPMAVAASPALSVRETHGQSVQLFLQGLLAGRLPAAPAAPMAHAEPARSAQDAGSGGAPTRPAHDSLSLSSVFGEDSTPTPPAVPATGAAASGPGGVSYDEFFGGAGESGARPARPADPKSDDLDQFHAWLQNLKR